jgi:signal transduction histidine kinase
MIDSFSHELRTPLNSADNFLSAALLSNSIEEGDKETYLRPSLSSLKLQRYLINDIIDFS